jgi:hypothetical protein
MCLPRRSLDFWCVLLVVAFLPLSAYGKYGGGSGTVESPYLIYTAEEMNQIGTNTSDWDDHFKLMADIDLHPDVVGAFNIIGTGSSTSFTGVFDGNGYKIINFSLTSARESYTGLFGYVKGNVKNLGLVNPVVSAQGGYVGALAGFLDNGTISDCHIRDADVSGGNRVGGLAGFSSGGIGDCRCSGTVSGDWYVGGLVGDVGAGTVTTSYATASVSGNQSVGGLVGRTAHEMTVVSNSYATGPVTGNRYVGGLAGQVERGAAYKCYSAGLVSGDQRVGGIVGLTRPLGLVSGCLWDTQTSGQSTSSGGTGKTTAELQMQSTFIAAGWDFFSTWTICQGRNYPVLWTQLPTGDFTCPDGVEIMDLLRLTQHWLQDNCHSGNSYCDGVDLNESGSVDFLDFAIFADNWQIGVP